MRSDPTGTRLRAAAFINEAPQTWKIDFWLQSFNTISFLKGKRKSTAWLFYPIPISPVIQFAVQLVLGAGIWQQEKMANRSLQ